LLARLVQEPLRDVLPKRVIAIEPDRVGGLDFHDALAAAAGDAQQVVAAALGCSRRWREDP
jgi:hypothetical protein